jgi:signal transduction histidine kinase
MATVHSPQPSLDKKRTIILLRSVVVVSTCYLIVFGEAGLNSVSIAYILALILSNVALSATPSEWFREPRFSAALLLGDTAVVLAGLYLTVGCFSQDFLIIYFFTIFLTTATESVAQIALGAAMISGLYGYWLWLTSTQALGAGAWLRLPFFFIVAVFYAYVTEETKQERWRRKQAERESEHLRFLLNLSESFSSRTVSQQLVRELPALVEAAFPRLRCDVHLAPAPHRTGSGTLFLVHSQNHTFGALRVEAGDEGPLTPDEEQFCKVVAAVTANALYAAEQATAAQDIGRLKQEFLSTLSHELRSPLHVILGNADILTDELLPAASPFVRESIERLRASAFRLLDLIEELLCFAELRAGKSSVHVESVDLYELFGELGVMMTDQLAGRPVRFDCALANDLSRLQTDRRKLRLIVSGLLSNAAKFTEQGFIRLSAQRISPEHVEIAVQDSGIGIDDKDLGSAFQEFRQLDGSLQRRFEGLGLGLTLAQELAVTLGGHVEVETQPRCGSTFRVRLPQNYGKPALHDGARAPSGVTASPRLASAA